MNVPVNGWNFVSLPHLQTPFVYHRTSHTLTFPPCGGKKAENLIRGGETVFGESVITDQAI